MAVGRPHVDDDVPEWIEVGGRAGWYNASRIVFLDDARSCPGLPQIGAVDDISVAPAMGRAEIGAAQRLCDDHTFW